MIVELGCLCGKAGTSYLCDGSAHSSGCVVNAMAIVQGLLYLKNNFTLVLPISGFIAQAMEASLQCSV